MNIMTIVDTCVWIEFFRNTGSELTLHLKSLLRERRVVMVGIVLAEILQGIKSKKEANIVRQSFKTIPYQEMTREIWEKSGEMSAAFRKKGVNLPLSDLIIAASALYGGYEIFTIDPHFEKIRVLNLHKY
ncbi:PIN domain-containing protein [Thermodesulfobacteriota bacterium]